MGKKKTKRKARVRVVRPKPPTTCVLCPLPVSGTKFFDGSPSPLCRGHQKQLYPLIVHLSEMDPPRIREIRDEAARHKADSERTRRDIERIARENSRQSDLLRRIAVLTSEWKPYDDEAEDDD